MCKHKIINWLAVSRCPRLGRRQFAAWCKLYPDIADLFSIRTEERTRLGMSQVQLEYFERIKWTELELELEWLEKNNVAVVTIDCQDYPKQLLEVTSCPLLLYVQGDVSCLQQPQFAFVGSRSPSPYGIQVAKKLAGGLATTNALVTSGMALGIDGVAHSACLDAGGKTIAVLGSGLKSIYPKRHLSLANRIIENGALVSEFPPPTPPINYNFPRRNRIISGLSNATIIIEAAEKSGSLITAKYALEQGRDVYAVPGNINNPLSKGPHLLLKQGAKLVETLQDIVEDFLFVSVKPSDGQKKNLAESKLLASVDYDTTPVDVVVQRVGLPIEKVLIGLLELEVQGLIAAVPGGYVRQA